MVLRDVFNGKGLAIGITLLMILTVIPPFSVPAGASGFPMDSDLKDSHASFWGEDIGDYSGYSVAGAGDVNGDGYDDMLIGAYQDDDGGASAGQTYLILGKASGWAMDTDLSNADASFRGEDAGDYSGNLVAGAGDVNGDGYDDILIGAWGDDDGGAAAGQTYLILGKASGWAMDTDLSSADASFWGEDADDWSGYSVAGAGDVNGDGYDDILIGALFDDDGGFNAGQTYLILGKASGWAMDTDLSAADASFWGEDAGDWSGHSVAGAGDVNGDGYDDILTGAYGDDDGGAGAGQTYLVLGKASGWAMDTDLSAADASFVGEDASDWAGWSVAGAGDVNGDGYDDILTGAYGDDDGGANAGQTYLVLGKASGWAMDTDLSAVDASFWGEDMDDRSGWMIAGGGDVNGDGYDDILIGAYRDDDGGADAGQTYLILGKASGWAMDTDLSAADASFWGEDADDRSGRSIAGAGDVNGDGYDDILIGAYGDEDGGGANTGQTYLIFFESKPPAPQFLEGELSKDGKSIQLTWDLPTYWKPISEFNVYRSMDGTNYNLITKMPIFNREYLDTDVEIGRVYYYSVVTVDGSGTPSDMSSTYSIMADLDTDLDNIGNSIDDDDDGDGLPDIFDANPWIQDGELWARTDVDLGDFGVGFVGEDLNDYSGYSVAGAGDVNGDGYDDILIGAYLDDDGGGNAGQTYLLLGKASGWAMDTDLSAADASFWGEDAGDVSGYSVAGAGDVNGDGYDDILIGANGDDDGGGNAGQTYLVLGKASGWAMDTDLSAADASFWGEDTLDYSGRSVAGAGDVNGDGYDDILIGAYGDDDGGDLAGQTYLILGKASGWAMDTDLSAADASFWGEDADDSSGYSVAGAGDVNGDGYDDILIGAYRDDDGGTTAGQTYLLNRSILNQVQNISLNLTSAVTGIHLSWDDTYNDPYFYGVYRGVAPDSFYRLESTTASNYTDTNVTPGVTYYYAVSAVGPLGGESILSIPQGMVADLDTDGDGSGNMVDTDDDDDGVPDGEDYFPLDATESLDTDHDGTGNTADTDDDNDGIPDASDPEPLNPLNGIQGDIDFINTTLQDVQGTVNDIEANLSLMDTTLTDLNTNVTDMNNSLTNLINGLASDIDGLNMTLLGDILALETDISDLADDITGLNATLQADHASLMNLLTNVNTNLTDLINSMSQGDDTAVLEALQNLSSNLSAMNLSLQQKITDLETDLKTDIAGLGLALEEVNASLQAELDALKAETQAFRSETASSLQEILDRLDTLELNLTDEIETTINNLDSTSLSEIQQQLTDIETKIDASGGAGVNNTEVLAKIAELKTDINDFRTETKTSLDNITALLAALDEIAAMTQDVQTIQQDIETMKSDLARLSAIESDIKEIEKEQEKTTDKVEGAGGMDMAMVGLLVFILVLILVILLLGRKKEPSASGPLVIEQRPSRRPRSKSTYKEVEEEEEVEEEDEDSQVEEFLEEHQDTNKYFAGLHEKVQDGEELSEEDRGKVLALIARRKEQEED